MIKLKDLFLLETQSFVEKENSIRNWLDKRIEDAPGKNRGEKLKWLWNNDASYQKIINTLSNFQKSKSNKSVDAIKSKRTADRYYVRFGNLPKGGKSTNWIRGKEEQGISAYPVKWSKSHNMWYLSTDDLSEIGINTLDSMVSDFIANKGRPIFLLYGQELNDVGIDDGEPLLDYSKVKIVKKLDPSEIWIDHYDGNDWWK